MTKVPKRDNPNYMVDGIPPSILAKITTLIEASMAYVTNESHDPNDAQRYLEFFEVSRYNLERTIKTVLERNDRDRSLDDEIMRDAKRWQALMASERIRVMGSSGVTYGTEVLPDGTRSVMVNSDYAHIGVELWSKHPNKHPDKLFPQEQCRAVLTAYADSIASEL